MLRALFDFKLNFFICMAIEFFNLPRKSCQLMESLHSHLLSVRYFSAAIFLNNPVFLRNQTSCILYQEVQCNI